MALLVFMLLFSLYFAYNTHQSYFIVLIRRNIDVAEPVI